MIQGMGWGGVGRRNMPYYGARGWGGREGNFNVTTAAGIHCYIKKKKHLARHIVYLQYVIINNHS